jgi:uncharacterized membrane protein YgcG
LYVFALSCLFFSRSSFLFRSYHPYIDNYDKASNVVAKLVQGDSCSVFLARLGRALPGGGDPSVSAFLSLLIRPVQAVPRYRLLLERLAKATPLPRPLPTPLPPPAPAWASLGSSGGSGGSGGSSGSGGSGGSPGADADDDAEWAAAAAALAETLGSAKECALRAEAGIQATAFKLNDSLKRKAAQVSP